MRVYGSGRLPTSIIPYVFVFIAFIRRIIRANWIEPVHLDRTRCERIIMRFWCVENAAMTLRKIVYFFLFTWRRGGFFRVNLIKIDAINVIAFIVWHVMEFNKASWSSFNVSNNSKWLINGRKSCALFSCFFPAHYGSTVYKMDRCELWSEGVGKYDWRISVRKKEMFFEAQPTRVRINSIHFVSFQFSYLVCVLVSLQHSPID